MTLTTHPVAQRRGHFSLPGGQIGQHSLESLLHQGMRLGSQGGQVDRLLWQQLGQRDLLLGLDSNHGQHFLSAAHAFHLAEMRSLAQLSLKRQLRQWVLNSFQQSRVLQAYDARGLYFPGHSHGYLLRPDKSQERRHCLILVNDLHTFKEVELFRLAVEKYLPAGFTCLLLDGPGQGCLAFDGAIPIEFEQVVQSAISQLILNHGMDSHRFSVMGLGLGGHLAMRSVSRLASIDSAINFGGPFDIVDARLTLEELLAALAFFYKRTNTRSLDCLANRELSLACLPSPQRRLLSIHFDHPDFFPSGESDKIEHWAGDKADSLHYSGTSASLASALEETLTWLLR